MANFILTLLVRILLNPARRCSALVAVCLLGLSSGSFLQAQDPTSLSLNELQAKATEGVAAQKYAQARPFLVELVTRLETAEGAERQKLDAVMFYIGVSYIIEFQETGETTALEEAIKWFDRYEQEFGLASFGHFMLPARGDAKLNLSQFAEAAKDYAAALRPPVVSRLDEKVRLSTMRKLARSLYEEKNWVEGEPWFQRLYQQGFTQDDRAFGAAALIEAYISQNKFKETFELMPLILGGSSARYEPRFNVALLDAGDRLAESERYQEAMLMYRMVLTTEEMLEWTQKQIARLETRAQRLREATLNADENERLIEMDTEVMRLRDQMDRLNQMPSYTVDLKMRIARNFLMTGRDWEAFWAYERLITENPDHPSIEQFMYAAFTGASKINFVDQVIDMGQEYLSNPSWEQFRSDFTVKLCEFYLRREDYEAFFDTAKRFIEQDPNSEYAGQLLFFVGTAYTRTERLDEMVSVMDGYARMYPDSPMMDGCLYWSAIGHMLQGNFPEALPKFEKVVQSYDQSPYLEDSVYRYGVSHYGMQNFGPAKTALEAFISKYPGSRLRGEAEFFLGDVNSALADVEAALFHYGNVEKHTTNFTYIQNAYFQAGELLDANRRYEEMEVLFREFTEKFPEQGAAAGAVYYLGRALEMQDRPEEMLALYFEAITNYGNDQTAFGVDQMIQTYPEKYYYFKQIIDQNLDLLERLRTDDSFRNKIAEDRGVLFGALNQLPLVREDIKRSLYGQEFRDRLVSDTTLIDGWRREFLDLKSRYPLRTPEQNFLGLYNESRSTEQRTAELRAQMALDRLDADPAPERIFTSADFEFGSPSTLLWMGHRMLKTDPSAAQNAFLTILSQYPESDVVFSTYLALGDVANERSDYQTALSYYQSAELNFPAEEEVYRAIIKQGDAYFALGRYLEARDVYRQIQGNREWRGAPLAEALFKMGDAFAAENKFEEAIQTWKSVYIGLVGVRQWAGQAYLEAGRAMERLGRLDEAREVYNEFLNNPNFKDLDVYAQVEQAHQSLQ